MLHKIPRLASLAQQKLEHGRDALIRLTNARLETAGNMSATIVFDGKDSVYAPASLGGVRVLFSTDGQSADDVIKRILDEAANPREVALVTEDRELLHYAKVRAVDLWSVKEFHAFLEKESRARQTNKPSDESKVIRKVFEDKVNRELEQIWLKKKHD